MDFYDVLEEIPWERTGEALNPYAGKIESGNWEKGTISIDYLNNNFGHYTTIKQMKSATDSEGLKLYFDWLKEKGILN